MDENNLLGNLTSDSVCVVVNVCVYVVCGWVVGLVWLLCVLYLDLWLLVCVFKGCVCVGSWTEGSEDRTFEEWL